ncbi:urea ABC transporter permease subunit UrtC [Synechococcus sp. AH-551-G15]|nr:urea ABC transporter permease subunit UrtC [Synechococcus sp. AH-779-G23]MBC8168992.1 urea ABC transporter permease subunit UrtC [Synechococcus sp.]MDA9639170.1 urea ABC transporter permease subunit UrtC [Synechococcus sp. AH-779-G23]MDC0315889.1 urea ABC transporter permease subunit UrtC [Synechococcus sp. AH-551-G15]RCL60809.1 MAG: urea ABC transporter permease subunit UrtC [Synechococcus sp. MED-G68]|tara:strand:- start:491 stop:1618 length:1128 start_codon:yes stop_codon:yes gene_type:complete
MMNAFQQRRWPLVILWVLIIAAIVAAPSVLPVFRLNLLGRFLALAIVALGIDLIWGFTGLLSLGQGIFFALGGYAAAMYLQLNSSGDLLNGIPEFFTLYGVDRLPAFWQPFHSPWFTLVAIWLVPGLLAGLLGNLVFRNRVKGVYFSILTQAALLVFFNFFNGQQKLINGTNGLKTDVTQLFGQMVGSAEMQRGFFWVTAVMVILMWLFVRWVVRGRFGDVLIAIRDDEPRLRFAGYNPTLFKTLVFAIAGSLAGIGGALYTVQSGIVSPQFMTVPFSIEMVIWVAVGGRGTLVGAILGAVAINYAKSLVSEAMPQSWLFIQGGLFILVVTALPEGVIGWFRGEGPRNLMTRVGFSRPIGTYPQLEVDGNDEVQP